MVSTSPELAACPVSTGLASLCFAARLHGAPVDPTQLLHALGIGPQESFTTVQIILAARAIDIKAKLTHTTWERLKKASLPVVAELNNGEFVTLARWRGDELMVYNPALGNAPVMVNQQQLADIWSGRAILLRASRARENARFGLRWFVPIIFKYKTIFAEILVASFFVQVFGLATPLLIQIIVDKVVMHKSISTLYVLGTGMVIIILFEAVLTAMKNYLMAHTANRVDSILGSRVFSHLVRLPLAFFEKRRVGHTVSHMRELETIRQFLTGAAMNTILDVLFIVFFLGVMLFYSVQLSLIVLLTLPFLVAISLITRPLMRARLAERFEKGAELQSFLVETVSGIHTVKSLAVEPTLYNKWQEMLSRYAVASFNATSLGSLSSTSSQLVQRLSTLAVLWVGAILVIKGGLTVGQLIAFQMLSGRVTQPIVRLVQLWQEFQQVALSVERLGDIMNSAAEKISGKGGQGQARLTGKVELSGVSFSFGNDTRLALNNISFCIQPGQTVAIVGQSGSGKSTLVKLLQALYSPQDGRIIIDGVDIKNIDHAVLRRQIGVVLQDNFLFEGSIRENISYHVPGASMESIVRAASLSGAHDFICEQSQGYDTRVGERGSSLSGGQRQRVAIARALLADPRILIFDEATSALDNESERIVQRNLKQICAGRTVFMIAHRLSTIINADLVIVLDQGRIVETGTHRDLMKSNGKYVQLFGQNYIQEELEKDAA